MSCPFKPAAADQDANPGASSCPVMSPIPQPPEHLFGLLGNLPDIEPSFPMRAVWKLQALYGDIMRLRIGYDRVFVASQKFVNELSDQDRFEKVPLKPLLELRPLLGDGLFSAYGHEENWGRAHRLLVPHFGPLGIRKMFDSMMDIAGQMVLRWDRMGPAHEISVTDDCTKLAFDTIAFCAFSHRFNEFYTDGVHPFAGQMARVLLESGKRASRPEALNLLHRGDEQKRQEDIEKMISLADEIIAERKRNPQPDNHDLLNAMLNGVDPETGDRLSDENIRFNLITFLVAGHETTSGTLSFCFWNFLSNPEKLHKAQQIVDEVLGDDELTLDHLPKLAYLDACLKETLRLTSPIPSFSVNPKKPEVLGGKYEIPTSYSVSVNLKGLHTDPVAWGDDALVFRPERMIEDGGLASRPPNSWKPFGTGPRACIGRGFAEQEMVICLALVLQRFQVEFADPTYKMQMVSSLTIKPSKFNIKVRRRPGKSMMVGLSSKPSHTSTTGKPGEHSEVASTTSPRSKPFAIFFGGNTGTCEGFAQELQTMLAQQGYEATVKGLDSATEHLPNDRPVAIISSSYEGRAPDNAKKFVSWLEHLHGQDDVAKLKGVRFSVFGVGNSDWASTFHRIPTLIDETLKRLGADRILDAHFTDVKTDLVGPFEKWTKRVVGTVAQVPDASATLKASPINVTLESSNLVKAFGPHEIGQGKVIANYELAGTAVGLAKRHIDVQLPEGTEYHAGDYLVVYPRNPLESVRRVLSYFALSGDEMFSVQGSTKKHLPAQPVPIAEFLSSAVELALPITTSQLEVLAEHAQSEAARGELNGLCHADKYQEILSKRYTILDVLQEHSGVALPLGHFINMLKPLSARQYSISSSPLHESSHEKADKGPVASITFDVHSSAALSGHGMFEGVSSTYLAGRLPGDRIHCAVHVTNVGFRLPNDPATPVIMVAAGTGIAPMRAFMQERAAILNAGQRALGLAVLFYGCRNENDLLYASELKEYEERGVVQVKTAFSKPVQGSAQYVQDVMWDNRELLKTLYGQQGNIFLCGSAARLGKGCAEVCKKIHRDSHPEKTEAEAQEWFESISQVRYVSDVY